LEGDLILIESDLLLAYVKREDRLKPVARKVLTAIHSGKLEGFYASTATLQEIIFWFFNRRMLKELILAVNALVHIKNLEWVPLSSEICLTSTLLMSEYGLNPFDAYHAATAIARDKKVLSTEHVYDRVKGIERIEPNKFVKDLV
jgi:predicted nucleic acid-binding protein